MTVKINMTVGLESTTRPLTVCDSLNEEQIICQAKIKYSNIHMLGGTFKLVK